MAVATVCFRANYINIAGARCLHIIQLLIQPLRRITARCTVWEAWDLSPGDQKITTSSVENTKRKIHAVIGGNIIILAT